MVSAKSLGMVNFHHEKVTRPLAAKSGKRQLQHNYALENLIKK
jgi:hypothetical protein